MQCNVILVFVFLVVARFLPAQQPTVEPAGFSFRWKVDVVVDSNLLADPMFHIRHLYFPGPIQVFQDGKLIEEIDFDKDHQLYLQLSSSQYGKGRVVFKGECHESGHFRMRYLEISDRPSLVDRNHPSISLFLQEDNI